ncbi:MAG: vWA domain-containing protein [Candidatus Kariarchaeaceae archaeon]
MDRDKLLEAEIVSGKRATNVYADLSKGMAYYQIKKQTELALEVDNMPAVQGLAMSNHFAVADTLSSTRGYKMIARKASSGDSSAPELFFMLRGTLNETYRPIFKRLAKQTILKVSQGITGQGLRGRLLERTEYVPGMEEFNIEETIEKYIETGGQYLKYEDIVGLKRAERTKTGVLMFDTSGSLFGRRFTNAALAIAILAYHLSQDNYSVILFNTKAYVIKRMDEKIRADEVVNRILDAESAGYTNISEALRIGGLELAKIANRAKFGILVSDGTFNRGEDPRSQVNRFRKLHVMGLPSKQKWGERVCKDLARKGGGRYIKIDKYSEIPRQLMELLRRT